MNTNANEIVVGENATTHPVTDVQPDETKIETIAHESLQTPPLAENTTTTANNDDATANEDEIIVKKGNRVAYTCNLSVDEDLHVQTQISDLIKFGVVENKADFIRKAIDVYLNYNNVCSENNIPNAFVLPVPDGKDGSVAVTPKLLRNSLFKSVSKLPTF